MKALQFKILLGVLAGFTAGLLASNLPHAVAASNSDSEDLAKRPFDVAIFEIKEKLTPGQFLGTEFAGSYHQTITMSDGKQRQIALTPMMHKGMQVVRLQDSGHTSYMGLNGKTLNGKLLVQLRDKEAMKESLKAQERPGE